SFWLPRLLPFARHPEALARPLPAWRASKGDGPSNGCVGASRNFRGRILRGPRVQAQMAIRASCDARAPQDDGERPMDAEAITGIIEFGLMHRRAGEPELRDLLGSRDRKLLEVSLGLADVLRQPYLILRPQHEYRPRRDEAQSRRPAQDQRRLEPIAVDGPLDHVDRHAGGQREPGNGLRELSWLRERGDFPLAEATRLMIDQAAVDGARIVAPDAGL